MSKKKLIKPIDMEAVNEVLDSTPSSPIDKAGSSQDSATPKALGHEADNLREALEDMVWQFAYRFDGAAKRPPSLSTGGLSALEHAFSVLDWPDPKKCPDSSCDLRGCQRWPSSGVPLPNGDYWSLCSDHRAIVTDDNYMYFAKKQGRGYNAKQRAERLARR
jgi:hypothetical protein